MSILRNTIDRIRNREDLGLDHQAQQGRQRTINRDGSYNMKRIQHERFNFELFHWLINTSWKHYWLAVFLFYGSVNFLFACIFYAIGPQFIYGILPTDGVNDFLQCFFFSNQTFTTVGYGGMHPIGLASSWVASIEAFIGLMSFALATGTLYGRFSKPNSKIKYSAHAIIAPFRGITAFQFMVANQRNSNLMEIEATVNYSWVDKMQKVRKFQSLPLEISKIAMFPTSWTVNHIIDEESPFFNLSNQEILEREVEVFVLLKGFDETFSGTIYSRGSYTSTDIVYGAKFRKPFTIDESGMLLMNLRELGAYDLAPIEKALTI